MGLRSLQFEHCLSWVEEVGAIPCNLLARGSVETGEPTFCRDLLFDFLDTLRHAHVSNEYLIKSRRGLKCLHSEHGLSWVSICSQIC
jgi:hypothetical protein